MMETNCESQFHYQILEQLDSLDFKPRTDHYEHPNLDYRTKRTKHKQTCIHLTSRILDIFDLKNEPEDIPPL